MGADCTEDIIYELREEFVVSLACDEFGCNINFDGVMVEPTKKQVKELIKALEESLHYFDKRYK